MTTEERREKILNILEEKSKAMKGSSLSKQFDVTRQVIVKDIAILRAAGNKIIATPEGYILNKASEKKKVVIPVMHKKEDMEKELRIIIKHGGIIEDVIIEHIVYGEIKGNLMIKHEKDIIKFIEKVNNENVNLLSNLTEGVHLHTISVDNECDLKDILNELDNENLLIR